MTLITATFERMGVFLLIVAGVVSLNIAVGAALLTKYVVEQRRRRLSDTALAAVLDHWQRELTHH